MNSLKFNLVCTTTAAIIALFYLLSPAACLTQTQNPPPNPDTTRNSLSEGKTRLGSTPPTCHNKCNQCHPCRAVQVPTMPSHDRFQPGRHMPMPMEYFEYSSPSYSRTKYSNYKPLGWKCRCGNHFYNP